MGEGWVGRSVDHQNCGGIRTSLWSCMVAGNGRGGKRGEGAEKREEGGMFVVGESLGCSKGAGGKGRDAQLSGCGTGYFYV